MDISAYLETDTMLLSMHAILAKIHLASFHPIQQVTNVRPTSHSYEALTYYAHQYGQAAYTKALCHPCGFVGVDIATPPITVSLISLYKLPSFCLSLSPMHIF